MISAEETSNLKTPLGALSAMSSLACLNLNQGASFLKKKSEIEICHALLNCKLVNVFTTIAIYFHNYFQLLSSKR